MASLIPVQEKLLTTDAWAGQTLKVALLTSALTAAYNYTIHYTYTAVLAYEHAGGTGYTAGGASITTNSTTVNSTTVMLDSALDTSWGPGATLTNVKYAALYDTVSLRIRALYEFTAAQSCTNSTFTVQWHANGMVRIL